MTDRFAVQDAGMGCVRLKFYDSRGFERHTCEFCGDDALRLWSQIAVVIQKPAANIDQIG